MTLLHSQEKSYRETVRDIINCLAIIIRTSQLHHKDNAAVKAAIQKLVEIFNPLITVEKVTLKLIGEFFQLNDSRVRYTSEYCTNFDFLIDLFKKLELGTIIFKEEIDEDDVKNLVSAFMKARTSEAPFNKLTEMLSAVPYIKVEKLEEVIEDTAERANKKKLIKKTYSNAVSTLKGVLDKMRAGETVSFKKSKRLLETVTDHILEEESKSVYIGLTSLKDHDDYTYHHCVNVSILSIALGQKIGLSRKDLVELGLAALYHDVGKIRISHEILNKPSSLSNSEWEIMMKHPVWGALSALKIKGVYETSINIAISAFEHHLNHNLTGYPKSKNSLPLEFYSKIITIADIYDALTSSRVYKRTSMSPDRALGLLIEESGKKVDPHLIKVFVQMIGVYPIGCLVMLNTNEMGLVFENNPVPSLMDRPKVMIIADSKRNRAESMFADLTEKDEHGQYIREIIKTLDPNKYGINLSEYLL